MNKDQILMFLKRLSIPTVSISVPKKMANNVL